MARSAGSLLFLSLMFLLLGCNGAQLPPKKYDWNIEWMYANPDGQAKRPVMGINGEWPIPTVEVMKGQQLIVTVHNGLGNESTGLHWHGLFQNGTNEMDGAVWVTQCPIPPGATFTYNFTVDQPGTYW